MLIDTHCHLDRTHWPDGPEAVIQRARDAGVGAFVVVGVGADLEPAREAVALASSRRDVYAAVGVHPHDACDLTETMLAELAELGAHPRVVAIGEMGLDYHYMHSTREQQQGAFRRQIELARTLRKPIVIHTREAAEDTLRILEEESASEVGGIIHCFTEDLPFAKRALKMDFDISFSGIVTFKSARAIQEVAAWAPADRILVETDSPYLAPVPMRGKACEPAYVAHTARFIADLRGESFEALAERSTQNAVRRLHLTAP